MNPNLYADEALRIAERAALLADQLRVAAVGLEPVAQVVEPFVYLFAVFLMACFVGYYVVWNVTPALHSPLMAVTNAISSVIIVGALLAVAAHAPTGELTRNVMISKGAGAVATAFASVNIFGGFLVVRRMLAMYKKKAPAPAKAEAAK